MAYDIVVRRRDGSEWQFAIPDDVFERLALLAQSMIPPLTVASRFKDLYADAEFRADELGVLRRELGDLAIAAEADEELRGVLRGLIRSAAKAHADDATLVGLCD